VPYDLHLAFDRLAESAVAAPDPGAQPDRSGGDLLQLRVGVPAGMVANVLDGVPTADPGLEEGDRDLLVADLSQPAATGEPL